MLFIVYEVVLSFILSRQIIENQTQNRKEKKNFIFTDKEAALLINVIIHYKADKLGRGIHWNAVREKFTDITKLFINKAFSSRSTIHN